MGATAFFGNLLLGFCPALVVFVYFIAPKSFLVLLTLFRCVVFAARGDSGGAFACVPSLTPAPHPRPP